jgi:hypothetical protein
VNWLRYRLLIERARKLRGYAPRWKCWFRHDYETFQELFVTHSGLEDKYDVVIAWRQCRRCAHSKLVHILR